LKNYEFEEIIANLKPYKKHINKYTIYFPFLIYYNMQEEEEEEKSWHI